MMVFYMQSLDELWLVSSFLTYIVNQRGMFMATNRDIRDINVDGIYLGIL